jgi:hypothetical protein
MLPGTFSRLENPRDRHTPVAAAAAVAGRCGIVIHGRDTAAAAAAAWEDAAAEMPDTPVDTRSWRIMNISVGFKV